MHWPQICTRNMPHSFSAIAPGIPGPWRYSPGTLASALTLLQQPAPAGFFTPVERPQ